MIGKDKPSLKSAYIGQIEKQKILVKCPPDPPISPIVHWSHCHHCHPQQLKPPLVTNSQLELDTSDLSLV